MTDSNKPMSEVDDTEQGAVDQFIINAPADEAEAVLKLMLDSRDMFARSGGKIGWGWALRASNGKTYFVRETKRGLSAREARRP